MELMKLATQEQLVHSAEVVNKYRDLHHDKVAPVALPLPSSVVMSDVKPPNAKGDGMEPIVVRKDSISLEDAIGTVVLCWTESCPCNAFAVYPAQSNQRPRKGP